MFTAAMDAKILKNIINSTVIPVKKESIDEWKAVKDLEEFPTTKSVAIDGLSKSFTKLLSYRVSREAYQRYSVRLHVIETLRDWTCVKGDIGKILLFQDSDKSHDFFVYLLKKYLKEEHLNKCDDINHLIQAAEVLLNSIQTNRSLMKYFIRTIERIISLDQDEKSEEFLTRVISKSDELRLELSLIEKIYVNLKLQLIEKPLTDCFVAYCSDQNKKEQLSKMNFLFEKIIDSSLLFQLVANLLKDLFVKTKYAEVTQNFIKNVLEKIQTQCNKYNKETLDLYPLNLQYCVILLRIQPIYHAEKSKNHTVQSLKEIFFNDYNNALILVSHFPEWLPNFLEFSENLEDIVPKSHIECIDK